MWWRAVCGSTTGTDDSPMPGGPAAVLAPARRLYPGGMSMTRERQLVEAFVEAADTLVDDFDVIEFLHTLAGRCVQLLDVDAAGLMLADQRGQLHATAASTENARLLELFELQADAGPCVDCFRTGLPVVNADLQAQQERWPRFAEAAGAAGFVAVHALPLRLRSTVIGALNLFCARPGVLSDADVRTGQALADVATIGILAQRGAHQADLLSAQLQNALTSRVIIEQAKGVLAERRQITVDQAFALLRDHARSHNLRLSELAREIADGSNTTAAELLRGPDRIIPQNPGAGNSLTEATSAI
jgi:transcriptional regulator with GAF, ATPase, and Fis domain